MLKILRVTNDLYPDVVGGIPLHAHHLCRDISKMGYPSAVLTCTKKRNKPNGKINDCDVIYHKILMAPMGNSFSPSLFITLMKKKKEYDIIHAHCHLFFSTIIAACVRKIGGPPLIITTHGIMSSSASEQFNMMYMKTIGKWTLKSADTIICYTEKEKEKFIQLLQVNPEKIRVIPNGVDTTLFCPTENINKEKNNNETTLLWVGRFVPGKRVDYIIQATKILVKDYPNLKILLVGDGPLRKKIEDLIDRLDLRNNITIIKDIANEKLPQIYQTSDIFVLPSLNEGVPKTLLEAMACGKPVVISELPHLNDLIQNCGFMFPKQDVHAFAENILKLIKDKETTKTFGLNARKKIIQDHSWENTVKKTVELYEEIAGQ